MDSFIHFLFLLNNKASSNVMHTKFHIYREGVLCFIFPAEMAEEGEFSYLKHFINVSFVLLRPFEQFFVVVVVSGNSPFSSLRMDLLMNNDFRNEQVFIATNNKLFFFFFHPFLSFPFLFDFIISNSKWIFHLNAFLSCSIAIDFVGMLNATSLVFSVHKGAQCLSSCTAVSVQNHTHTHNIVAFCNNFPRIFPLMPMPYALCPMRPCALCTTTFVTFVKHHLKLYVVFFLLLQSKDATIGSKDTFQLLLRSFDPNGFKCNNHHRHSRL